MQQQNYDCFLVLDFEATCQENYKIAKQEIIEFPVLKVDATTFDVTDKFHEYIRPIHNPQLTDFCTKLTGITQEMVDESDTFPTVFGNFQSWMVEKVGLENRFLFVTCGDWDLKSMLPEQCKREKILLPAYFDTWMNIKKTYAGVTGSFVKGMKPMLQDLNIKHVGRLHSGIDDCRNIASILTVLANLGTVFRSTSGERRRRTSSEQFGLLSSRSPAAAEAVAQQPEDKLEGQKESMKQVLYPPLSDESSSEEEGACSQLYQPCNEGDADEVGKSKEEDRDYKEENRNPGNIDENTDPQIPDFQAIVVKLRENIASRRFKTRDREELTCLCTSGKYLHLMEDEDKTILESRLRLFYIALCYGWKVAERDAKSLTTASVGIHVAPEVLHRSARHQRKNLLAQNRVRAGMRSKRERKPDDFEFI